MKPFFIFILVFVFLSEKTTFSQTVKPFVPVFGHKLISPAKYPKPQTDTFRIFPERNFKSFTMKDGLAQMNVKTIFTDSKGKMWIGTYGGGVNIYDGIGFKTLNRKNGLPNNNVFAFAEDKEGKIWIATDRGVVTYDGKKIQFPSADTVLSKKEIWNVFIDSENRKWIASASHGIYLLDKNKLKRFTIESDSITDNRITCFAEDKNGNIYIGTWGGGILKYNDKKISVFLQNDKALDMIRHLSCDEQGRIWAATAGGIIIHQKGTEKFLTIEDGLPTNNVRHVFHAGKSEIWIATNNGISLHNGESFENINSTRGLPDDRTNCVYRDQWGTVWTATTGSGLVQLLNQPFYHFTYEGGFPAEHPSQVLRDSQNNIWVASDDNGLFKFNWNYWEHFSPAKGFKWKNISCLFEDSKGNIWFGTENNGAVKFDHHHFYEYGKNQNIQTPRIWSINENAEGDILLGTNWSQFRITKDSIFAYNNNNGSLAYYLVVSIFTDSKNNNWTGTFGGGLSRVTGKKVQHLNIDGGLLNNAVFSFAEDRYGNIWISNYGEGVVVIKEGIHSDLSKANLKYFNTQNELITDVISFVKTDKQGNIWLGSAKGLTKIELKKNVFEQNPEIIHYGYADGFIGEECRLNGFTEDQSGTLWIPSNGRITLFLQKKVTVDKVPPVIQLNALKLDLKEVDWKTISGMEMKEIDSWTNIPVQPQFDYYHNNLQFEFIGITFDRPESVEYQWKLKGFKEEWSPWSKQRSATFSNLPPGEYVLYIKARNGDKVISKTLEYKFIIHSPFWQRWWFRISAGIFILIILYGIYRWRTYALMKRQTELEKTVEIRTGEVVKQKHIVEEKQKEILDSINYARRIQYTLLANSKILNENLPEHFVLFKPKDIVSGDFYWATKKQTEQDNDFYLAVCDCTGHGVPGAFMSLLNISFLNEAINEKNIKEPHLVLNFVRKRLIQNMEGAQDGMDAVLVRFTQGKIQYAAAHNRPLLISKGEIKELPADKMPVGKGEKTESFTLHELQLQKGDLLYLYTDGYADQFGGEKGKKFKYSNLQKLLLENANSKLQTQNSKLLGAFSQWKGYLEQVDDVCIIGIRI